MDFKRYVGGVEEKVRAYSASPDDIEFNWHPDHRDTIAAWAINGRVVEVTFTANDVAAFALHPDAASGIPEARFQDDLVAPEFDSTAQRVAQFLDSPTDDAAESWID